MRCDDLSELLAGAVDGSGIDDRRARRHVESCLRCQAELVQYRRLVRALHMLRTEVLQPPPGLLADVLASLEEAGEREAVQSLLHGRRAAYWGGLAAATAAAGAAGAAYVIANRNKKTRFRLVS